MKFLGVVFASLMASALAHPVTHEKLGKVPEPNYARIDNFDISDPIIPPEPPVKPKPKGKPERELFDFPGLPSVPPWGPRWDPAESFGPFESTPNEPERELVNHPGVLTPFDTWELKKPHPFDIFVKEDPVKPPAKLDPKKAKESELIREEATRKLDKDWEDMKMRAATRNNKEKSDS